MFKLLHLLLRFRLGVQRHTCSLIRPCRLPLLLCDFGPRDERHEGIVVIFQLPQLLGALKLLPRRLGHLR